MGWNQKLLKKLRLPNLVFQSQIQHRAEAMCQSKRVVMICEMQNKIANGGGGKRKETLENEKYSKEKYIQEWIKNE